MKHAFLVCTLAAGMAWAQSPTIVQNTRTQLNTVQQNKTAASNEALGTRQPAAKDAHVSAKPAATPAKPGAAGVKANAAPTHASAVPAKANVAPEKAAAPAAKKPTASATPKVGVKPMAAKKAAEPTAKKKARTTAKADPTAPKAASAAGVSDSDQAKADSDAEDKQEKKWSMAGKRDPFISPVVNHTGGSGCSTGKKCLEIGPIKLRGVVHSDAGFIAVVRNSLNKAYFLRENDPVFDGYVVKITGDSIVFKETLQDRLGKSFTREVVKKITTPAV